MSGSSGMGICVEDDTDCRSKAVRSVSDVEAPGNLAAVVPISVGIKQDGVPIVFQTVDVRNFARYAAELATGTTLGGNSERISWIENQIHDGVGSSKAPTVPFHML